MLGYGQHQTGTEQNSSWTLQPTTELIGRDRLLLTACQPTNSVGTRVRFENGLCFYLASDYVIRLKREKRYWPFFIRLGNRERRRWDKKALTYYLLVSQQLNYREACFAVTWENIPVAGMIGSWWGMWIDILLSFHLPPLCSTPVNNFFGMTD